MLIDRDALKGSRPQLERVNPQRYKMGPIGSILGLMLFLPPDELVSVHCCAREKTAGLANDSSNNAVRRAGGNSASAAAGIHFQIVLKATLSKEHCVEA